MHWEAKEESTVAIFLDYLNQENERAGQRYMLLPWLSSDDGITDWGARKGGFGYLVVRMPEPGG